VAPVEVSKDGTIDRRVPRPNEIPQPGAEHSAARNHVTVRIFETQNPESSLQTKLELA